MNLNVSTSSGLMPAGPLNSVVQAVKLKVSRRQRLPKPEGNERLKNWTALPKGLQNFYKDQSLQTIIFRTSAKGTRIEIRKDDPTTKWDDKYIWYFTFNKVNGRFGMLCGKEETWIYSDTETGIME